MSDESTVPIAPDDWLTDKEYRRYRVSVEVAMPREDWLTWLSEGAPDVPHCHECRRTDNADGWIYVNSECRGTVDAPGELIPTCGELFCSWVCLFQSTASTVTIEEIPEGSRVTVAEIPDWRGNQ